MTRADLQLYRRMRGIFWGLLVVGILVLPQLFVVGFAVLARLEVADGEFLREVGKPGLLYTSGFGIASLFAFIGSVILGATSGSVDHQRGVLRDLVLTGRARWRIVGGRLLAALTLLVVFLAVSNALSLVLAVALAPVDADMQWEQLVREVATLVTSSVHTMVFASGIAMLVGSRGPAIAVYFVIAFLVDGLLGSIPKVRELWEHVSLGIATQEFSSWIGTADARFDDDVLRALLVMVAWAAIAFVAGIVRLTRREL